VQIPEGLLVSFKAIRYGVTSMANYHLQFNLRHKGNINQLTVKLFINLANKTIKLLNPQPLILCKPLNYYTINHKPLAVKSL
jgi:hypothetical protein